MVLQLTRTGLSVRSAANGAEALKLIAEQLPSVLVMDLGLPDISGQEVITRLREQPATCSIPVIIHTALDLTAEQQSLLQLGPTTCVTKTTALSDKLAEIIQEVVGFKV